MPAPLGHPPYNKNGEGGRTLKYTKEFIEKEADEFEKWLKNPESMYFKEFAFERGYSAQRFTEFAQVSERFAEVYDKAKLWQEIRFLKGGLSNEYNAGFCKFVMGNVCGWVDRQETKVSGDSSNPLSFVLSQIDGTTKDLIQDE